MEEIIECNYIRGARLQLLSVSESDNTVPARFVLPWVNFRDYFINDGPPGCL